MAFRPLVNVGNDVIQAFLGGQRVQEEKKRTAIESERLKQERELEEEKLAQQHDLESRHLDLLQKANEIQQLNEKQALVQKYQETGTAPPGTKTTAPSTFTPETSQVASGQVAPVPSPISTTLGMGTNQVNLNIPGIGDTGPIATPEAAATRRGQLGVLAEAPALEKQKQLQEEIANRNLALEGVKAEAANKLKTIEMDAAQKRTETANIARMYAADKGYQGRIEAAKLMSQRLTGSQKTNFDNLKDIEDSLDAAEKSLGDFSNPNSQWFKHFTASPIDEFARNNPTIGKVLPSNPIDTGVNSKFNALDQILADKGKYNAAIQQITNRGYTGSRNQTPKQAKDNLDALRFQIHQNILNVGSSRQGIPGASPSGGGPVIIRHDIKGNIIPENQ